MEELELSKNDGEINRRRGIKLSRREGLEVQSTVGGGLEVVVL
jgi:hypothetical protein